MEWWLYLEKYEKLKTIQIKLFIEDPRAKNQFGHHLVTKMARAYRAPTRSASTTASSCCVFRGNGMEACLDGAVAPQLLPMISI